MVDVDSASEPAAESAETPAPDPATDTAADTAAEPATDGAAARDAELPPVVADGAPEAADLLRGGAAAASPVTSSVTAHASAEAPAVGVTGGTERFIDVPKSHKFTKPIMWMKATGLSTGVRTIKGIAYKLTSKLTREAMAAFLYRGEGNPKFTPGSRFPDVPKSHKFYTSIMWMKSAGLTTGIKTPKGVIYRPQHNTTREATAAFLYRQAGSPEFIDSGTVKLSGTVMVAETVTAEPSGWAPSSTTYTYQWLKNGTAIPDTTDVAYTLLPEDEGATVQVKITGRLEGAKSISMTTNPVTVKGLEVTPGTVTVKGSPEVTKTLTASATGWVPAATEYTYQWYIAGSPVAGATSSTYTLAAGDLGKAVTVRVTGRLAGYKPAGLTSKALTVKPKQITVAEATEMVRQTIFSEVNRIRTG
ncbi:S-layer family protein [Leucobacter luti]|uniref:S-layer homology domain-containing protein n=1 Tax=Leucobacter luti TaxID=340320 RepID=UPI0010445A1D|nr:S-layer homology domain-containing protein [Leucobacter luti]MCW2289021.1 hypothetical protein [Leucobacter luti]TCK44833.1 S-layer family protein [Leucobacter luti]